MEDFENILKTNLGSNLETVLVMISETILGRIWWTLPGALAERLSGKI